MFQIPGFKFQVILYKLNRGNFPPLTGSSNNKVSLDFSSLEVSDSSFSSQYNGFSGESYPFTEQFPVFGTTENLLVNNTNPTPASYTPSPLLNSPTNALRNIDSLHNSFNWKNIINEGFDVTSNVELSEYKNALSQYFIGVAQQGISSIDITQYLIHVSGFETDLNSLSNTITFSFQDRDEISINYTGNLNNVNFKAAFPSALSFIDENDVIEFIVTRTSDVSPVPVRNFIGFATSITKSVKYKEINTITVTCFAFGKLSSITNIISDPHTVSQFEGTGSSPSLEITNPNVTPFLDTFNNKSASQIFTYIMNNYFNLTPDVVGATPGVKNFVFNFNSLANPDNFQLAVTLMFTMALARNSSPAKNNATPIIAQMTSADSEAFNIMIRNGFELFYSTISSPEKLLDTLRSTSFLEVFETRAGVITMRLPRYNTFPISSPVVSSSIVLNKAEQNIINPDDVISFTMNRHDLSLKTRMDLKMQVPFLNAFQFTGGHYTDVGSMVNYGMRAEAPGENPNARNKQSSALLSALYWAYKVRDARTMHVIVKNTQDYFIGNLYFMYDLNNPITNAEKMNGVVGKGFVGYLEKLATDFTYGRIPTHSLAMTFVRQAHIIKLNNGNYVINFRRYPDLEQFILQLENNVTIAEVTGDFAAGSINAIPLSPLVNTPSTPS